MLLHLKCRFHTRLSIYHYLFLFSTGIMTSCTKSATDPKPPISDSVYLINGLSVYLGGDSTNWNVSTQNVFLFDTTLNQLNQTITESTFGDPNTYSWHTIYQYDNENRLKTISFDRDSYVYKSMSFQYNANGDLEKAVFTDLNNAVIENDFSKTVVGGNTVITQYDTLSANLGNGQYISNRPAVLRYTFNSAGKLIDQYTIGSELYNGLPAYQDTAEIEYQYDGQNHLRQVISHSVASDNQNNIVHSADTTELVRDNSPYSPMNDLALAALHNLDWLTTCDDVRLFGCLYSAQYGHFSREEPLKSTYDAFQDRNYAAAYSNTFDAQGLLTASSITTTEHNIYNSGTSTHETHYFSYLKVGK